MSEFELIMKDLDEDAKNKFLSFISMCDDLESLISRENTILLDKGSVAFDGIFTRKINMLSSFEEEIRNVLVLAKNSAPENMRLQNLLVERIQDVRRALSINATFQLRDLKRRTERMAVLKSTLLDFSKNGEEGDAVCH